MTKPRKQPAASATIADLIAKWRGLEAKAAVVNASAAASVKAKDAATSRAYKVIAEISNAPAESMGDVLLKLLFAAEVFNPDGGDDVDAPPLAHFILPVIEDAKRLLLPPQEFPGVADNLTGDDRLAAMLARRNAMVAWANAVAQMPGIPEAAWTGVCEAASAIDRKILATPAQSMAGVAVKAGLLAEYAADQANIEMPAEWRLRV
jgi:hypothetical protein